MMFVRAEWERLPDEMMVAVDFQKAYDLIRQSLLHLSAGFFPGETFHNSITPSYHGTTHLHG